MGWLLQRSLLTHICTVAVACREVLLLQSFGGATEALHRTCCWVVRKKPKLRLAVYGKSRSIGFVRAHLFSWFQETLHGFRKLPKKPEQRHRRKTRPN